MRTTKLSLAGCLAYFLFVSCKQWEVPPSLVGNWQSKQKVTVRDKQRGDFVFINAPDSISLQFNIDANGNVSGHLGDAVFENCKVQKNRSESGKRLNLATDYIIKGELKGAIFSSDPHLKKEINAPFDIRNNKMEGSLFQRFGLDLYPITGMDAIRKDS